MAGAVEFRRAVALMTAASALVPVIGLVTAPILAQALGVEGRGEVAVAVAPNLLIVGVATLGLPEALTFHLAKRPERTRRALWVTALVTTGVGLLGVLGVLLVASTLADGDQSLAWLISVGTVLSLPALATNLLRGAASGRQMWTAVALERVVTSLLRLGLLGGLALTGRLDVLTAVLVTVLSPVVAGLVYWRLFLPPPDPGPTDGGGELRTRELLGFGSRIWLGAIASIVMARLSQLVTAPLSDVEQLGLLVVAITISDVPFIVAQTIRDVVFGADSSRSDPQRLAVVSRLTTGGALAASVFMGGTAPWWIGPLFGAGFEPALWPTLVLLASTVLMIPGLIAGAGLAAVGRPGVRSAALVAALLTNVVGLVVLVPPLGAIGAALAALVGSVVSTTFGVVSLSRANGLSVHAHLVPTWADLTMVATAGWRFARASVARAGRRT